MIQTHCIRGHILPPPINGRRKCVPCSALWRSTRRAKEKFDRQRRQYNIQKQELRIRLGLCVICGHSRDDDDSQIKTSMRSCLRCRDLRRGYSREYYRTHSITAGPGPVAINRNKTVCIRGHMLPASKNGHRNCQTCKTMRKRIASEFARIAAAGGS
jgi:hypothetical protein